MLLSFHSTPGVGTMITADPVERLRSARVEDVRGILALIEPLETDGTLVKRSRELLEAEIGNFLCGARRRHRRLRRAVSVFPDDKSAEFACLALGQDYRDGGYGERLLKECEAPRKGAQDPPRVCAHYAGGALVSRAGLSPRRRRRAALAPPGAV